MLVTASAEAQVTAFPGAEGYGRFAIGGRGGAVHRVASLANSGPGTFRALCRGDEVHEPACSPSLGRSR